ncbi:hypothetical protein [Nostoc parmelioides]|uniref:Uncharacterized protein n=1 Tax=Nostoc parmelioides FACHB-3921 TaxID=2692909 RepID=A0ABR8BSP9_9NOSO|nr:hypothetical protein [Nostoc parmelioides]MBD2255938.1 hypothetical protein [Nostoc parmelioides FACHB-3921]
MCIRRKYEWNELETLLSQFHSSSNQTPSALWHEQQENKVTPQSEDGNRQEGVAIAAYVYKKLWTI